MDEIINLKDHFKLGKIYALNIFFLHINYVKNIV